MGFFDTLFGGSSNKSKSKPIDLTPPEYTALRSPLANALKGLLTAGGPAPYTGPLNADMTPQQTDVMNQAVAAGTGTPDYLAAAQGEVGKTLGGGYMGAGANPYLDQMIAAAQHPITRAFTQTVIPQLLSRFTSAGQETQGSGSSAFANASRGASADYLQQLADVGTNIAGSAYEGERNRMGAAVGQAQGLSSDQINRLTSGLQASALPQMIKDLGIQRGLAQYNASVNALLEVLKTISGVTVPTVANKQKSIGETHGAIFKPA